GDAAGRRARMSGICGRSRNFQLHSGRFQKPGQMPYDLRDRGAEIAISNGVEPGAEPSAF
ncbi:MAG: hypothetical protein ACJ8FK_21000, partial [Xanthobacteraceae bacterium]